MVRRSAREVLWRALLSSSPSGTRQPILPLDVGQDSGMPSRHTQEAKWTVERTSQANTDITGFGTGLPQPKPGCRELQAQAEGMHHRRSIHHTSPSLTSPPDSRPRPTLILHGRQVPRLLYHHNRLLARTDRRHLRRLLTGALPANRWQGPSH